MLLRNATVATMSGGAPYGLIGDAAIAIVKGLVHWIGPADEIPTEWKKETGKDLEGRLVTPGLVDCHTHIVFGGNRAAEFELRLKGASYEEIAKAGGGIVSTVDETRSASDADLLKDALCRVDQLIAEGVTTLEVKSGYGLDIETELKMLRVARAIPKERSIRVKTSFLGAHAIPGGYLDQAPKYIEDVCLPALELAASQGLVDAVDGFCERIAFSVEQLEPLFCRASELGVPVKLHAEQLSNSGGCHLAAKYRALSADHVEYATEADAAALAQAGTSAVLLPGAFYTLRETQLPPVQAFRDLGVPMALATDCNPGSSPMTSLLLAMNMGCTLFRLTPEEALAGATLNAAQALGLTDCGSITPGLRADLAIWDVEHPAELSYRIGSKPLYARLFGGEFD